jgi:hypothetical protein
VRASADHADRGRLMPEYLMVGQVGDPSVALPGGAGAELYRLSAGTYGQQLTSIPGSTDQLLKIQTDDVPVAGKGARTRYRRIYVTVSWDDGAPVLQITPVIDRDTMLAAVQYVLPTASTPKTRVLEYKIARVGTYIGCIVEVLSRSGLVEIGPIEIAHQVLEAGAPTVAGVP